CMDNDDYRRGRLTNHKVYGEAIAVLAGDALLTAAFSHIAASGLPPKVIADCEGILADAAGENGMVGGQVLDMEGETKALTEDEVHCVHALKTGRLISAACCLGVAAAQGSGAQLAAAKEYAEALGLAFQIRDDMLDVLGDAKKLGKATHMDEKKTTFVDLYGVDQCAKMVKEETQRAISALGVFADHSFLAELANDLAARDH
ncbi:MAG: polyprenyl synthetase family protein, partial [Oscillospiraceae bacterium]|nr:polyprenyl synthetase family protein [Oscillospiraceae bacterium]